MKLLAFCEAAADFRPIATLVDRVLRDHGPPWLADMIDGTPEALREWVVDSAGRSFWDLHRVHAYASELGVRRPYGHFNGEPGAFASAAARTVFAIARHVAKTHDVGCVVLVSDMDQQAAERRKGLAQARREAESWARFAIVLGCANAEREAWALVGFVPGDDHETVRVEMLSRELGFSPVHSAHLLDASHDTDKRSPKRVLAILTGGTHDREARCWTETSLDLLRKHSAETGLAEFLKEIETRLLPLLLRRPGRSEDE